ncbi:MAG: hypothetical protein JWP09_73 [Candidatus Taylorbacteria bacterium]|nr:hypothetical protein [Candidatus Taylorbacteria bacterium]
MDFRFRCWQIIRGDEHIYVRTHPSRQILDQQIIKGAQAIRPKRNLFQEATRIFTPMTILINLQTGDELINSFEIPEEI